MALRVLSSLGLALLAALAVDLGFGAAFVDDAVAYPICAYVGALAALVIRRAQPSSGAALLRVRVPVAAAVAALSLLGLRTIGHFELAWGSGAYTPGHWPYFTLPVVVLMALAVNEGLVQWQQRRAAAMA